MPAFWIGIAMIAFDMLGHGFATLARLTDRGDLWNKYAPLIWPVLSDGKTYDIYWTVWFATAIVLIVAGHFSVGDRSPRVQPELRIELKAATEWRTR